MSRLPPAAEIDWGGGVPRAVGFDDIYYSRSGGLAETNAVFLAGCGLPEAWAGRARFAICELGFGAGLNALATWRLWRQTRAPGAVLHFVSIEAFPMRADEAARAHEAFPEIAALSAQLIARWPVRAYAPQRLWFAEDGFALTVIHERAEEALESLVGEFDAFFLDGFTPARNGEMWSETAARRIAACAAPGARAASYSVAGSVRRALESAGFDVEKKAGFGGKRERLEARLTRQPARDHALYPYGGSLPRRVAIIGGGIAGAATARAVTRRGGEAIVFEAGAELGAGASGNPVGLVMPRLDRGRGPLQEFYLAAFLHAVDVYHGDGLYTACGALEFARRDLIEDPPLPPDWLCAARAEDARHLHAGLVAPRVAIAAWTRGVEVRLGVRVAAIEHGDDGVALRGADGALIDMADAVIIAAGAALDGFAQTNWLTLRRTAGQVEWGALGGAPLEHALVGESYAAPFADGVAFGATFERVARNESAESAGARAENLAALAKLAPALAARVDVSGLSSRASVRAAAPDYAPIAGLAPDAAPWLAQQDGVKFGRPPDVSKRAPAAAGVYLFGGLGARGLTLAPLVADRIASEMFGEPQALQRAALDALSPARFLHRMLKKGLTTPASVKDDG